LHHGSRTSLLRRALHLWRSELQSRKRALAVLRAQRERRAKIDTGSSISLDDFRGTHRLDLGTSLAAPRRARSLTARRAFAPPRRKASSACSKRRPRARTEGENSRGIHGA